MEERKETEAKGLTHGHGKRTDVPVKRELSLERKGGGIWSTLDEMERWMEESMHRPFLFDYGFRPISRLLHDLRGEGEMTPSVDVYTAGNEVVLKAELPGMNREDISVRLVDNNLTISGEKKTEERVERKDYLRLERSYGSFLRTLHLPEGCVTDKLTASYKDGVLEIRVPREVRNEAKTITIE
ncbi:Hsp20/alpha crystallin family protein [Geobacter sp. OR-1]|uniref:Hsp20/alpha crystallin family protein n=1 Tax=Geobacter sp. OR-1 TaxID=1266765 RepID=UPI0009DDD543|nr:Hsp20/alpha crystallin family protein [Geobacter sp. OR-1]